MRSSQHGRDASGPTVPHDTAGRDTTGYMLDPVIHALGHTVTREAAGNAAAHPTKTVRWHAHGFVDLGKKGHSAGLSGPASVSQKDASSHERNEAWPRRSRARRIF